MTDKDLARPYKVLVLGDYSGGLSHINRRYTTGEYSEQSPAGFASGVEFSTKTLSVSAEPGAAPIECRLQIWDTGGQEKYAAVTTSYYRGAAGVALVYSALDRTSFDHLSDWVSEIQRHIHTTPAPALLLLGHEDFYLGLDGRVDLTRERAVSEEEAEAFAQSSGFQHFPVSAQTGKNINEAFATLTEKMLKNRLQSPRAAPSQNTVQLKPGQPAAPNKPASSCCE